MKKFTLIAACDKNGCIGKGNKLPWNIRSEMEYFLRRVAFKPLIMGKNTCLSLKKPINSATNYVLTSDKDFKREGFTAVNSMEEMLHIMSDNEHIVVGGASIYEQFIDYAEENDDVKMIIELSIIDTVVKGGDAYFPFERLDDYTVKELQRHNGSDGNWVAKAFIK